MMQTKNSIFLSRFLSRIRLFAVLTLCTVAACAAPPDDVSDTPEPLGQFRLGHNIAIADHALKGPFSRDFAGDQIEASVQSAIANRLRRHDGDGLYHLGVVIGSLILSDPNGPALYARQPAMVFDVTVFDDSTGQALNETPHRITAGNGFKTTFPILGTRFVPDAEVQLQNLSVDAARQIDAWLATHPEWFAPRADQLRVPFNARVLPPKIDITSINDIDPGAAVN